MRYKIYKTEVNGDYLYTAKVKSGWFKWEYLDRNFDTPEDAKAFISRLKGKRKTSFVEKGKV